MWPHSGGEGRPSRRGDPRHRQPAPLGRADRGGNRLRAAPAPGARSVATSAPKASTPFNMMRVAKVHQNVLDGKKPPTSDYKLMDLSRPAAAGPVEPRWFTRRPPADARAELRLLHGLQHHADAAHRPDRDGPARPPRRLTTRRSAAAPTAAASSSSASGWRPPRRSREHDRQLRLAAAERGRLLVPDLRGPLHRLRRELRRPRVPDQPPEQVPAAPPGRPAPAVPAVAAARRAGGPRAAPPR